MGDAIPMEWILEIERDRDHRHKVDVDKTKVDNPEWYDLCVKYAGQNYTAMDERHLIIGDTPASKKFKAEWKKIQEDKIKKCQKFAFTFTTNAHCDDWVAAEQDMIKACHKLYSQTTNTIVEGDCYLEYTKDGRPHVHGWYQTDTGGRVYAKVFQRIWNIWDESKRQGKGFQGGFHEKVQSLQYEKYASAEERKICGKERGVFTTL